MSHPDDPEPVDTTDAEDAQLLVADPDDYHEAQRLREIHEARRNIVQQISEMEINESDGSSVYAYEVTRLANLVAVYAMELSPLIRQAGLADHDNVTLPDRLPHDSIFHYASAMGMTNGEPSEITYSMHIFERCNTLLAEMKPLVSEEEANEWEV